MSKERARRRAEREAAAAVQRARVARRRRRRQRLARLLRAPAAAARAAALPLRRAGALIDGSAGNRTALGRQRNRQNGTLAAVLIAGHAILWLLSGSWWLRSSAAVLTVLAWPLLTVLIFDRRSTR